MNDVPYAKKTSADIEKAKDLFERLSKLLQHEPNEHTVDAARRIINDVEAEWTRAEGLEPLRLRAEKYTRHAIRTYALGKTFEPLNAANYYLVRDGVFTIGAEANAGKSSFLTALALDILRHNDDTALLLYTLDDSETITARRILSQLLGENLFYSNPFENVSLSEYIAHTDDKIGGILDRVFLCGGINLDTLETDAIAAKTRAECEKVIIGIDYLQIIPVVPATTTRREVFNDTIKRLKEAQKRLEPGCLLLLVSQLNRDVESLTYRYRETSEIENQSDVCVDIKAPLKRIKDPDTGSKKTVPDMNTTQRRIVVTKNKLGLKGRRWRTHIKSTFNFTPLIVERDDGEEEDGNTSTHKIIGKMHGE